MAIVFVAKLLRSVFSNQVATYDGDTPLEIRAGKGGLAVRLDDRNESCLNRLRNSRNRVCDSHKLCESRQRFFLLWEDPNIESSSRT